MFSVGALWTPVLGSGCGGGGIPHTGTLGGIHPDPNSTSSHGEKSAEPRWKRPREPDWQRTARRDDNILDVKRRAGAVIPVDLEITTRLAAKSALHCDPKDPVEIYKVETTTTDWTLNRKPGHIRPSNPWHMFLHDGGDEQTGPSIKGKTPILSFNCQSANDSRFWTLSDRWGLLPSFVCLQSTGRTFGKFDASVEEWQTRKHVIWEAKAPERKKGNHDYQPAGLAIMAPKPFKNCLKQLRVATGDQTGRAMMCFFHTAGISVALVNVYCWVQTTAYDCAGENAKIWNQVILWLQDLPQNTMIIVCTDCNGHVGSHREFDPTLVTADDLGLSLIHISEPTRPY